MQKEEPPFSCLSKLNQKTKNKKISFCYFEIDLIFIIKTNHFKLNHISSKFFLPNFFSDHHLEPIIEDLLGELAEIPACYAV